MKKIIAILAFALLASACAKQPERACSPPSSIWGKPRPFGLVIMNKIALDRNGATYWNGVPVTQANLDKYLTIVPNMNPIPVTFLEVEMGAPCASLDAVRRKMEERLHCSERGPCAEGILEIWEHAPMPPGSAVS